MGQVKAGNVRAGQVRTEQVRTGPVRTRTGQLRTGQVVTADLLSTLTWDCNKIKLKTYTWNSSVALLSPTCFNILLVHQDQPS